MSKQKILKAPAITGSKLIKSLPGDIDCDQLMLHSRQLHLVGPVCPKIIQPLIKQIMALQLVSDDPIILWINSGGGYINDGFALIDCIRMSKVPIYTVVRGQACSMASLILVSGHTRIITENSWVMMHDAQGGDIDYVEKVKARIDFIALEQKQVFDFLKNNTKLTDEELKYAKDKELWLNPDQCLEKGIVDQVIKFVENKKDKK
jgi:ATP-dependent Clp protease, protease subunit